MNGACIHRLQQREQGSAEVSFPATVAQGWASVNSAPPITEPPLVLIVARGCRHTQEQFIEEQSGVQLNLDCCFSSFLLLLLSSHFIFLDLLCFPFTVYSFLKLFKRKEPLKGHVYLYLFNTDVSGRFTGKCCK